MSRRLAAVESHHHTADVAGAIRRQENREVGDLVGFGGAAERHVLGEFGPALGIAELLLGLTTQQGQHAVGARGGRVDRHDTHTLIDAS